MPATIGVVDSEGLFGEIDAENFDFHDDPPTSGCLLVSVPGGKRQIPLSKIFVSIDAALQLTCSKFRNLNAALS